MSDDGGGSVLGTLADALTHLGAPPDISDLVDVHVPPADPGREVVDLPDRLALPDVDGDDVWPTTLAPVRRGRSLTHTLDRVTARLSGDYVWCTWLADVLRRVGLPVVEHPGWKTRGRPLSVGPFTPRGVCWHHDASPRGPSPYVGRFLAEVGRPAEGIPAPLSQTWVCAGCEGAHRIGTWHVLAAGRANHAGEGDGWGLIRADTGNTALIGVETDNTSGEPTPMAMLASLVVGSAAIMRRLRSDPRDWMTAHKEYARGRKIDPDDIPMDKARRLVVRTMRVQADGRTRPPRDGGPRRRPDIPDPSPFPGREHFQTGYRCSHGHVTQLGRWLVAAGFDEHGDADGYQPGPVFTEYDRANLVAYQLGSDRPGVRAERGSVGPHSWHWIQVAAARARDP